jgi:hypothetical protein
MDEELIIPLPNGGSLRCGQGDEYEHGGYVRVCDSNGKEKAYWDKDEWQRYPELVMGGIFREALGQRKIVVKE